jgi:hypothetical protein
MEFLETMAEIVGSRCNVFVHAVIQGEVSKYYINDGMSDRFEFNKQNNIF